MLNIALTYINYIGPPKNLLERHCREQKRRTRCRNHVRFQIYPRSVEEDAEGGCGGGGGGGEERGESEGSGEEECAGVGGGVFDAGGGGVRGVEGFVGGLGEGGVSYCGRRLIDLIG